MKKIEAVIRSNKLDEVERALNNIGVSGITVSQVLGWGRQKGNITEVYRGNQIEVRLLPKVKIETVVPERQCDRVIDTIIEKANTGKVGDGVIWVSPVEHLIRIRTGELETDY